MNRKEIVTRTDEGTEAAERTLEHRGTILSSVGPALPRPSVQPCGLTEPLAYPGHFEVRYVSRNGGIRWNKRWVCVSHLLMEQHVGLEAIDDDLWNVYFGPLKLGRLLEKHMRIEDAFGRLKRYL